MMLEELQSIRRAQYLVILEDKEAKLKREVYMQEILQSEKGIQVPKNNLSQFKVPSSSSSGRRNL